MGKANLSRLNVRGFFYGECMLSLTLFLLAVSSLVLSKRILGDYFTPPAIYTFFWGFSLGMLELGLVSYDPLRDRVWQAIGGSYAAFMLGCAVPALYAFSRPAVFNARPMLDRIDRKKFERILLVLFILGIAGFLIQLVHLQSSLGLGTFLSDPSLAREKHSNVKFLGFFNLLNVSNFVLALMYLGLFRKPRKWVLLILLWAVLTTLVTTDRTRFFFLIIWGFYALVFLYRRVNLEPRFLITGIGVVALLMVFFLVVAKVYKKEAFADNMEFINMPTEYAPLVDPYIYLTGSFPVFQAMMEDKQQFTGGKHTFSPFVKVIELVYPDFAREELVGKFYRVPIELNAATYLELFYKDFGFLGVILCPLVLGLICMTCYLLMRQRKTLFSVYFMSLLSFCITISIFGNHFVQVGTWFFVAVGYIVYRGCFSDELEPIEDLRDRVYS